MSLNVKEKGCSTCRYPKHPPKGSCTHPWYTDYQTVVDKCLNEDYAWYRPLGNRKEK